MVVLTTWWRAQRAWKLVFGNQNYVLYKRKFYNRSVLCNCGIEVENNFLLKSLAACHDTNSKLVMYFTVNTAFVSYFDSLNNLTYSLKEPLLLIRTTHKQTLPVSLPPPGFDSKLLTAPITLEDFVHLIQLKKKIFDLQEWFTDMELQFFNNFVLNVFLFVTAKFCYWLQY